MNPPVDPEDDESRSKADEYIFKHALTHDVSYESLLLARRRELHRRAAEAIEELFPDKLDEQAAVLGQHYAKAELPEKAVGYLGRAGDRAAKSYANEEAIAFYRQALDQINLARTKQGDAHSPVQAAELHERVGDLLEHRLPRGGAGYIRPRYGAKKRSLPEQEKSAKTSQARLYRKIAKTHETQRNFQEALHHYNQAETRLGETSGFTPEDWGELIETRLERTLAYYFLNKVEEMGREVTALGGLVESRGTLRQRGDFARSVIMLRFRQERFAMSDETVAIARQTLRIRQEDGNLLLLGHAYFALGMVHVCRLELTQGEEQLQTALGIAERTGDITLLSRCLAYLVQMERRRQDIRAAGREVKRLLPIATRGVMKDYLAMAKATLAWIAWREGDSTVASAEAEAALALWSDGFAFPLRWNALWPLIAVATARKNASEVVKYSRQLLDPIQQPLPKPLAARVEEILAANESGRDDEALEISGRVVQLARELTYL